MSQKSNIGGKETGTKENYEKSKPRKNQIDLSVLRKGKQGFMTDSEQNEIKELLGKLEKQCNKRSPIITWVSILTLITAIFGGVSGYLLVDKITVEQGKVQMTTDLTSLLRSVQPCINIKVEHVLISYDGEKIYVSWSAINNGDLPCKIYDLEISASTIQNTSNKDLSLDLKGIKQFETGEIPSKGRVEKRFAIDFKKKIPSTPIFLNVTYKQETNPFFVNFIYNKANIGIKQEELKKLSDFTTTIHFTIDKHIPKNDQPEIQKLADYIIDFEGGLMEWDHDDLSMQTELPLIYEKIRLLMGKTYKAEDRKLKIVLASFEMKLRKCKECIERRLGGTRPAYY